jgi:hypothetical protein
MDEQCWHQLELAPGASEREIRRAYARLVKTKRPDRDPEGFQTLRRALEQALAWTGSCGTGARDEAPETAQRGLPDALAVRLDAIDVLATQNNREGLQGEMMRLLSLTGSTGEAERLQLESGLLALIGRHPRGMVIWDVAQHAFGWNPEDPVFIAAWPQVAERWQIWRCYVLAWQFAQLGVDQPESALPLLEQWLKSEAMVSLEGRQLFAESLAYALSQTPGLGARTFECIARAMGWPDERERTAMKLPFWREIQSRILETEELALWNAILRQAIQSPENARQVLQRRIVRATLMPFGAMLWINALRPGLTRQVRAYLDQLELHFAAVLGRFDPETLHFWRERAWQVPTAQGAWARLVRKWKQTAS